MDRLQKVMAHAGVASRRKSETIIEAGRVKVNGKTVTTLGFKVSDADEITVDGKKIRAEKHVYYLLNKPRQVISSADDQFNRKTVVDLIKDTKLRIYPIGRLDYDTSGVLLLTNDGELANKLTHPSYEIDKIYQATVIGVPTSEEIAALEKGVRIGDDITAPGRAKVSNVNKEKNQSVITLTIHEGKYHQVKLMIEAIGHKVISLHRTAFGPITDKNLRMGQYRKLTSDELNQLKQI